MWVHVWYQLFHGTLSGMNIHTQRLVATICVYALNVHIMSMHSWGHISVTMICELQGPYILTGAMKTQSYYF